MQRAFLSPRYLAFIEALIAERKAANLTQAVVADRLGKPQSYVAKYENHERRIDVIEFLEIADAIGFSASKLIKKL